MVNGLADIICRLELSKHELLRDIEHGDRVRHETEYGVCMRDIVGRLQRDDSLLQHYFVWWRDYVTARYPVYNGFSGGLSCGDVVSDEEE